MKKPITIQELKGTHFSWVDVEATTPAEMDYLREEFRFHALDLQDCLHPTQRPKLVVRPDYLFMILLFPFYDRKTKKIKPAEVDFFISSSMLITVHGKELQPLVDLFKLINDSLTSVPLSDSLKTQEVQEFIQGSPANILYEILARLTAYCFPMLVHISNDIDQIEENILVSEYRAAENTAKEILRVKTNIVNFRKATRPLKYVIERLILEAKQFFSVARLNVFFEKLVNDTREIWDLLENYKDTIDALHETNQSMLATSTNQIMKALTVFAAIVVPASAIAAIFSMSFEQFPFSKNPLGFWIILGFIAVAIFSLMILFKKKKWI